MLSTIFIIKKLKWTHPTCGQTYSIISVLSLELLYSTFWIGVSNHCTCLHSGLWRKSLRNCIFRALPRIVWTACLRSIEPLPLIKSLWRRLSSLWMRPWDGEICSRQVCCDQGRTIFLGHNWLYYEEHHILSTHIPWFLAFKFQLNHYECRDRFYII